jgi:hypothetical protein
MISLSPITLQCYVCTCPMSGGFYGQMYARRIDQLRRPGPGSNNHRFGRHPALVCLQSDDASFLNNDRQGSRTQK